jgi:fatty-acyl-CoA synthase
VTTNVDHVPSTALAPWTGAVEDDETTVVESLRRAAAAGRQLICLDDRLRPQYIAFTDLLDWSDAGARALVGRFGVAPGDRVCVFGQTTPAMLAALLAIWRAGAMTVVLPVPRRLDAASLAGDLASRVAAARSRLVLCPSGLGAELAAGLPATVVEFNDLSGVACRLPAGPQPADPGLLQFTSGTTAAGRAVAARHGQMVRNPATGFDLIGMRPGDTFVSWLPLYHDMGIMTMIASIDRGLNLCLMATQSFIQWPGTWLQAITTYHGKVIAAPNSAYGVAATILALGRSSVDLSSVRCAVNGAEMIDRQTVQRFVAAAAKHGMAPEAMCPMYGLAEATLGVSITRPFEPARFLRVNRASLEGGRVLVQSDAAGGRDLASCGRPLPGTAVVVTGDDGQAVPAGEVGEIRVAGPSVVGRYWTPDGSPYPEPMCDVEGRLMTGDLGFVHDGELYVCGRKKDMVIIAGRNLYPEDYELVSEQVPGIRAGNVMAFVLPGTERMVVVAETRLPTADAAALGQRLLDTLREELSYAPHEAVLVRPGTLPKTTSGKRRRQQCRADYQQGRLDIVAVVR